MRNWNDIVIRLFDKGAGFFLLERDDYIERTLVHLNDRTTYEVVTDLDSTVKILIDEIVDWTNVNAHERGMTERIVNWVIPNITEHHPGNLYLNPKRHKPPLFPGRLITTGCGTYIKNLSKLTALKLKKADLKYRIVEAHQ